MTVPTQGPFDDTFRAAATFGSRVVEPLYRLLRSSSYHESNWKPDAKSSASTATGLFQTTQPALDQFNIKAGKRYTLEDITDPVKAAEVARWHYLTIANRLSKAGLTADWQDIMFVLFLETAYVLGDSVVPKAVSALKTANQSIDLLTVLRKVKELVPRAAAWMTAGNLNHIVKVVKGANPSAGLIVSNQLTRVNQTVAANESSDDVVLGGLFLTPKSMRLLAQETDAYIQSLDKAVTKLDAATLARDASLIASWKTFVASWAVYYKGIDWFDTLWGSTADTVDDFTRRAKQFSEKLPKELDRSGVPTPPGEGNGLSIAMVAGGVSVGVLLAALLSN